MYPPTRSAASVSDLPSAEATDADGQRTSHGLQIVFVEIGRIIEAVHETVADRASQAKPTENIDFEACFRGDGEEGIFVVRFAIEINVHSSPASLYAGKKVKRFMLWRYETEPKTTVSHFQAIEIIIQQTVVVGCAQAISTKEEITGHESETTTHGGRPIFVEVAVFNDRRDEEAAPVAAVEERFIPVVAPLLGEYLSGRKCEKCDADCLFHFVEYLDFQKISGFLLAVEDSGSVLYRQPGLIP